MVLLLTKNVKARVPVGSKNISVGKQKKLCIKIKKILYYVKNIIIKNKKDNLPDVNEI